MIIYPAIDLKSGKCVRLYKGDMNKVTVFNDSPSGQAAYFSEHGFKFIHIVDLDGAVAGKSINQDAIKSILRNVKIPVQLGGGVRDLNSIENWLNIGVSRVIIGTAALDNPGLVRDAAKKFPGKIVVGIDAKNGMVATHGWVQASSVSATNLAKQFEDSGVAAIIYTDINRDGTMVGPNLDETKQLAQSVKIPIIASGGVSSLDDIRRIKAIENLGVVGVIVGRALYDKKIEISDLLSLQN